MENNKRIIMSETELVNKWIAVFGADVDKEILEEHVTSYGNHLWHLFTWGEVACRQGEEAKKAFDELQYDTAIRFYDGYSNHIEKVSVIDKISAKKVDKDRESDVYIVAETSAGIKSDFNSFRDGGTIFVRVWRSIEYI